MGMLQRLFRSPPFKQWHASEVGAEDLSGNTLVPGSKAFTQTHTSDISTTPVTSRTDVVGPRPAANLHTGEQLDPDRVVASPDHMQPQIPVQEHRGMPGPQNFYLETRSSPATPTTTPKRTPIVARAPTQVRIKSKSNNSAESYQGATVWDGGSPHILREQQAHTESQHYFNEGKVVQGNIVYVPAHGVEVPRLLWGYGWQQAFVPEPGMRLASVGDSPPLHQSRPIHVSTVQSLLVPSRDGTPAKAPVRQREL